MIANGTECDEIAGGFFNGSTLRPCPDLTTAAVFATTQNLTNITEEDCTDTLKTFLEEEISVWLWKVLPPIIFFFGVLGNFLTVCVVRRIGLRNQPTLVFIYVLAITDTVVIITGLSRYWPLYVFDYDTRTVSNVHCKLFFFVIYFTMQYSSWILVGLTTERVLKIYFPFKHRIFYTTSKVKIGLVVTLIILVLLNSQFFFTNGIIEDGNCTSLTPDFFYYDEHIYVWVDFSILSIAPFAIMFCSNIFLIRMLRIYQRDRGSMMDKTQLKKTNRVSIRMTKVVIACTIYFLLATAPISVYFILDTYYCTDSEKEKCCAADLARMELARTITYLIQFSHYGVNFYLYTATNSKFGQELRALLKCQPSLRQMRVYSISRGVGSVRAGMVGSQSVGLDERSLSDENNS